jgi:hypothetical protein
MVAATAATSRLNNSTLSAATTVARACQCSFCRKYDACAISDPSGLIIITSHGSDLLGRYSFGLNVLDFLFYRKCGVYVSAYTEEGGEAYGNIMVNVLNERTQFPHTNGVHLDGETSFGKWKRHSERGRLQNCR